MFPPLPEPPIPLVDDLYAYRQGPVYTPEAEAAIYDSLLGLPLFDVTEIGSQWAFAGSPSAFQSVPPTVYPAPLVAGFGGIQAGQFYMQPLQEPEGM